MKKTLKKSLSLLLAILMVLTCVPVTTFAAETSGSCGENATWSFDEATGTLTISGTGATNDYSYYGSLPWYSKYRNKITNVVIEKGITYIGNSLCYCGTNITIPSTVTGIHEKAFQFTKNITLNENNSDFILENNVLFNKDMTELICFNCDTYEEYTIPDGVTVIRPYAFKDAKINTLNFSDTVTTIKVNALENSQLKTVNLSNNLVSINNEAFFNCKQLANITIPETNSNFTVIDNVIFDKNITKVIYCAAAKTGTYVIPESVKIIDNRAFNYSMLEKIVIPSGLTSFSLYSFYCASVATINIPEGVTRIPLYCFWNCTNLKDIILPNTLTAIDTGAFDGCKALTPIIIPENVTSIGNVAFAGCSNLTDVFIYNNTCRIADNNSNPAIPKNIKIHAYCYIDQTDYLSPYESSIKYGNEFVSLGHAYGEWIITKEATPTEQGVMIRTCTICNTDDKPQYFDYVPVEVEKIVLESDKNIALDVGATSEIKVSILPTDAVDKTLTFTSDKPDVAKVDANGVITAVNAGDAIITITAASGVTETINVTVNPVLISDITVTETEIELLPGATYTISPVITPNNATDKTIIYKSSAENVATVDKNGVVTAVNGGTTTITITASDGSGKTAEIKINVKVPVTGLEITNKDDAYSLHIGENVTLKIKYTPENTTEKNVIFESSDDAVVTVNKNGEIIATGVGEAMITVKSETNSAITDSVKVNVDYPIYKITFDKNHEYSLSFSPFGGTDAIYVKNNEFYSDENAENKITKIDIPTNTYYVFTGYYIDRNNPNTQIVDVNGNILDTDIVFTSNKTLFAKWQSYSLHLNTNFNVSVGATNNIISSASPSIDKFTFISLDDTIATIDKNGIITGIAPGTTTIKILPFDSEVNAKYIDVTVVTPVTEILCDTIELTIVKNNNYNINASFVPADTINYRNLKYTVVKQSGKDVAWINSNENGLIRTSEIGTATIEISLCNKDGNTNGLTEEEKALRHTIEVTVVDTVDNAVLKGPAINANFVYFADDIVVAKDFDASNISFEVGNIYYWLVDDAFKPYICINDKLDPELFGDFTFDGPYLVFAEDGDIYEYVGIKDNKLILYAPGAGFTLEDFEKPIPVTFVNAYSEKFAPNLQTYNFISDENVAENAFYAVDENGEIITPETAPFEIGKEYNIYFNGIDCLYNFTAIYTDEVFDVEKYGDKHSTNWLHNHTFDGPYFECYNAESDYYEIIGFENGILIYPERFNHEYEYGDTKQILIGELVPTTIKLQKGNTMPLELIVTPYEATYNNLTFVTTDTNVATVADDVLTAIGAGTTTITISLTNADGSPYISTVIIEVYEVVESVDVTVDVEELKVDETIKINTTVNTTPEYDDSITLTTTYVSETPDVATVDENGVITGVAPGEAVVKVIVTDNLGNETIKTITLTIVPAYVPVTDITVTSPAEVTLNVGENSKIEASADANATNGALTYTSSAEDVVKVEADGTIVPVSAGTAIITIKPADGSDVEKTVAVTIKQLVTDIIVTTPAEVEVAIGETTKIEAAADADASNKDLVYTSSNPAVATVDKNGNVTAVGVGTAVITIKPADGSNIEKTITITVKAISVESITATVTSTNLNVGDSTTIATIILPENATNKTLTFASSDTSVVTVSANGKVTAMGPGTATITITSADSSVTETLTFTIKVKPSITVKVTDSVSLGEPLDIIVETNNDMDYVVEYESSDDDVIRVDENGNLVSVGDGTATITAKVTFEDGTVVTKVVTVKSVDPDKGKFFCSFCDDYEAMKDSPVGFIYTIIHFFIHMIQSINFAT